MKKRKNILGRKKIESLPGIEPWSPSLQTSALTFAPHRLLAMERFLKDNILIQRADNAGLRNGLRECMKKCAISVILRPRVHLQASFSMMSILQLGQHVSNNDRKRLTLKTQKVTEQVIDRLQVKISQKPANLSYNCCRTQEELCKKSSFVWFTS